MISSFIPAGLSRRDLLALLAAGVTTSAAAGTDSNLSQYFAGAQGVAIALDLRTKRLVGWHRLEAASKLLAPPGSVLKPLVFQALFDAGKLHPSETIHCTGNLTIGGRSFACVHPKLQAPVNAATALAYSCNQFTAHMASRFSPGELTDALLKFGLGSPTHLAGPKEAAGAVERATSLQATRLQALGEQHVEITALGLAAAYERLASRISPVIVEGLEGAVAFGTAQNAGIPNVKVAGKTGSAPGHWAWFAGFAPSRKPEALVVVLVRGDSGGADAAPVAARILASQLAGKP